MQKAGAALAFCATTMRYRRWQRRRRSCGVSVEEAGEEVSDCCRGSADGDGLDGAAQPAGANELSFQRAKEQKRDEGDDDGELEGGEVVADEHVGQQRNEAAGD